MHRLMLFSLCTHNTSLPHPLFTTLHVFVHPFLTRAHTHTFLQYLTPIKTPTNTNPQTTSRVCVRCVGQTIVCEGRMANQPPNPTVLPVVKEFFEACDANLPTHIGNLECVKEPTLSSTQQRVLATLQLFLEVWARPFIKEVDLARHTHL